MSLRKRQRDVLQSDLSLDGAFLFYFVSVKVVFFRWLFVRYLLELPCDDGGHHDYCTALNMIKEGWVPTAPPCLRLGKEHIMGRQGVHSTLSLALETKATQKLRGVIITELLSLIMRSDSKATTPVEVRSALCQTCPSLCETGVRGCASNGSRYGDYRDWKNRYQAQWEVLRLLEAAMVYVPVTRETTWAEAILICGVQTGFVVRDGFVTASSKKAKESDANALLVVLQRRFKTPFLFLKAHGLLDTNLLIFSIVICMDFKKKQP